MTRPSVQRRKHCCEHRSASPMQTTISWTLSYMPRFEVPSSKLDHPHTTATATIHSVTLTDAPCIPFGIFSLSFSRSAYIPALAVSVSSLSPFYLSLIALPARLPTTTNFFGHRVSARRCEVSCGRACLFELWDFWLTDADAYRVERRECKWEGYSTGHGCGLVVEL